jgi:alpha-L-fucosidase 2
MTNSLADNLHNQRNNQSDASFGLTAAIAEALLQSQAGEISLLPALPPSWSSGSVRGLRARGGFEVDIAWHNGKLTEASIHSLNGDSAKLRYGSETREVKLNKRGLYRWNGR